MSLSNIQEAIISEIDYKNQKAIVVADGRPSDWLKILSIATPNKKQALALSIKDQVLVINPHGVNGNGYILGGIFSNDITPPKKFKKDTEVTEYSDGTVIVYDLKKKIITVDTPSSLTVNCKKATIKANAVLVDSSNINLGNGGKGVVTGATICPFTGSAHSGASTTVKATS